MIGRTPLRSPAAADPIVGSAAAGPDAVTVELSVDVDGDGGLDGARWAQLLADVLAAEGVPDGAEVGLSFVSAEAMTDLNEAHMGATGPTDVLAFPIDGPTVAAGGVVGDVVICPSVAAAGAADHAGTPEDEIALLVVHAALHLLGHDHGEPAARSAMQAQERALLAAHHGPLGGDPWAAR